MTKKIYPATSYKWQEKVPAKLKIDAPFCSNFVLHFIWKRFCPFTIDHYAYLTTLLGLGKDNKNTNLETNEAFVFNVNSKEIKQVCIFHLRANNINLQWPLIVKIYQNNYNNSPLERRWLQTRRGRWFFFSDSFIKLLNFGSYYKIRKVFIIMIKQN